MKKWVSVLLGTTLLLAMPVNAFATGFHLTTNAHLKLKDGKHLAGGNLNIGGNLKVKGKVDADGKTSADSKVILDSNAVKDMKITVDGLVDAAWDKAQKVDFKDPVSGLGGNFRMMWDSGNLYVLAELNGAAKLWKDSNKAALLSLFYNGDQQEGDGKNMTDGYVALTWPDMAVVHGSRDGCLKADKLVKAFAVNGDNVDVEFKLPWENLYGKKMTQDTQLGLYLNLKALDSVKPDVNGQVTIPVVTEQQILNLKPAQLTNLPLQLVDSLAGTAPDNGNGTGGATTPGNGIGAGTGGTKSPGTGTSGSGTGTGSTTSPGSGTAVGGATDTGVIPAAMPRTGGGGASEWTD
jgi:hypothetical protein